MPASRCSPTLCRVFQRRRQPAPAGPERGTMPLPRSGRACGGSARTRARTPTHHEASSPPRLVRRSPRSAATGSIIPARPCRRGRTAAGPGAARQPRVQRRRPVHLGQVGPVSVDPRAPLPTFGIPGIRVNLGGQRTSRRRSMYRPSPDPFKTSNSGHRGGQSRQLVRYPESGAVHAAGERMSLRGSVPRGREVCVQQSGRTSSA